MNQFLRSQKCKMPSSLMPFLLTVFFAATCLTKNNAQCTLACNDQVEIAVPPNGSVEVTPAMIAAGNLLQFCPNGIFQIQAQINSVWTPANGAGNFVADASHIGQTLIVRLRDENTANACWGEMHIVELDTVQFKLCSQFWKNGQPLKGTTVWLQPINQAFPYAPFVFALDTSQSCADVKIVPEDYLPGTTFSYGAELTIDTNIVNGISSRDLCYVAHHILGIAPLPSPYAMIAADVNKSGSVTTFDMVESRKVIMGIYDEFPNTENWRFFSDYCQFPNPMNPFQSACQADITMQELIALHNDTARVVAVKVGDVDGDTGLNGKPYVLPVATDSLTLVIPEGPVSANASLTASLQIDKAGMLGALQARFFLDPALGRFDSITSAALSVNAGNYYYDESSGVLTFLWTSVPSTFVSSFTPLFNIHLTALQDVDFKDILTLIPNSAGSTNMATGANCGEFYSVGFTYAGIVPTFSPTQSEIRVWPPSPNPFGERSYLDVALETGETAILEVLDMTGKTVFSEEKQLPAGMSRWEIPASALVPGGIGFWQLRIGAHTASGKLLRR